MALSLTDFLPYYPSISDPDLQADLYEKKEFFDLQVGKTQEPPHNGKLNQQVLVQRLFSEYTAYDEVLLHHMQGTGKTCSAFALAEALKTRKSFSRCIVLARGDDSLDNLRRELVKTCSSDYTIEVERKTVEEEMRKIRRVVKDFYSFATFYTFAKEIAAFQDDAALAAKFNKTLFVVDEAHNIRGPSSPSDDPLIYTQLFRLFHLSLFSGDAAGQAEPMVRKILLLTATPMRDDVSEIADVMNLLLPFNKQLPTGATFRAEFLSEEKDGTFLVREDKVDLLKEYLRGRISYMSAPEPDIPIIYMSNDSSDPVERRGRRQDIPQFRSVDLVMSPHQSQSYARAYEADTEGEKRSIYTNSSQAALFVFPDGSWGSEGAQKYVQSNGVFIDEFARLVRTKLSDYSVKYNHAVQVIRDPENRRKNIYIYCSLVNGSGAKLLAGILDLNGYQRCRGNEPTRGRRYMLLTSATANITRLIAYFNRDQNRNGEYCQVIIGSRKIAEGYTFKNVLVELLLTEHWNESETSQAIRRGARFGSWNALLASEVGVVLRVSRVCAVPRERPETSVDKLMLEYSRRKDVSQQRMERVIKETAIDCPLMYERNVHRDNGDYSRECNYAVCEYKCDAGAPDAMDGGVDISTYELYYENFFDLVEPLIHIFGQRDSWSFDTLAEMVNRPIEHIHLLKALAYLIENNIPIENRYRSICYLREHSDVYYLTRDLSSPSLVRPMFVKPLTLDMAIVEIQRERSIELLSLSSGEAAGQGQELLKKLPPETIDLMVKLAIKEKVKGSSAPRVAALLERFKDLLSLRETADYVALYRDHSDVTWCLGRDGNWALCVAREEKREGGEEKYEGIVSVDGTKFCIRKTTPVAGAEGDKRKRLTGSVCEEAGRKREELVQIVRELNIPREETSKPWDKRTKKEICESIREWFRHKGLLRTGKCGSAKKKKA